MTWFSEDTLLCDACMDTHLVAPGVVPALWYEYATTNDLSALTGQLAWEHECPDCQAARREQKRRAP